MRVGTITYATEQGLGILAKSFYDHGIVTDVMVIRHGRRATHMEWYPGAEQITGRPFGGPRTKAFISKMDAMLFFETPFDWNLLPFCKSIRVKTALMPMHECMPSQLPFEPDLYINPSHLDQQCYPQGIHIPVPVEVEWKQRKTAQVYIHNAGHLGLRGRNGTLELLQAMQFVKSPIKLIVRSQTEKIANIARRTALDYRVDIRVGNVSYEELWSHGDVFVFPEKFNGLSLPLQEARASGMLVMSGNRFPMNQWLPTEPLIPPSASFKDRVGGGCRQYESSVFSPKVIAQCIDEWYGRDISAYSVEGREWAVGMSWDSLRTKYIQALEGLVQ